MPERRWTWPPDPEAELAEPEPIEPVFLEPIESVEERVRKLVGKVSAVRNLDGDVHPQIWRLLDKDGERRQKQAASRYPSSWDDPLFTSPFEQRRLKVLNSLFLACSRFGLRPSVGGKVGRDVYIGVGTQNLSLFFDHPKAKRSRWDEAQRRRRRKP